MRSDADFRAKPDGAMQVRAAPYVLAILLAVVAASGVLGARYAYEAVSYDPAVRRFADDALGRPSFLGADELSAEAHAGNVRSLHLFVEVPGSTMPDLYVATDPARISRYIDRIRRGQSRSLAGAGGTISITFGRSPAPPVPKTFSAVPRIALDPAYGFVRVSTVSPPAASMAGRDRTASSPTRNRSGVVARRRV